MASARLSISWRCDTTWLCARGDLGSAHLWPTHTYTCTHTHTPANVLSDRCDKMKWKLVGCSVRGGMFPFPGSLFLYLAHWPVALFLSRLCLWRTTRSHFRLPRFNGRPKSTLNLSFIKQWGHKEDGGVQCENPFYSKWALIPLSFPHTHTQLHTYPLWSGNTTLSFSYQNPVSLHVCLSDDL